MKPLDESTGSPDDSRAAERRVDVVYPDETGATCSRTLTRATLIGRGEDCQVQVKDPLVSRHHFALYPDDGRWWIKDLESSNGTLVAGQRIEKLPVTGKVTVQLGRNGPSLRILPERPPEPPRPDQPLAAIARRYLHDSSTDDAGERTMMIRQAFRDARRRQHLFYGAILTATLLVLTVVAAVALFQYDQLEKTRALAKETFYQIKELELQIADLEARIARDASAAVQAQIAESKRVLAGLRERYDDFVREIQAIRIIKPSSEEGIILRMARAFGETELDPPADFVAEVKRYIRKWQATPRLPRAIRRLRESGYAPLIYGELSAQDLPPQFLYLALQESGFRHDAVGPRTRYGHAKGMWQFIPDTARRYGLKPGPLQHLGRYDPDDDRHDVAKATRAAARYLKDIYRTDAQASGLLVMASYNWGEGNIISRLREMPRNPRERNFWALLREHRIPDETYDYVFYIFSAAVIGENPGLFGFGFEDPLQQLEASRAISSRLPGQAISQQRW